MFGYCRNRAISIEGWLSQQVAGMRYGTSASFRSRSINSLSLLVTLRELIITIIEFILLERFSIILVRSHMI